MFTGIVEILGEIVGSKSINSNIEWEIKSEFSKDLHINQSVSHNGVCLTVTSIKEDNYFVTVVNETIKKSSLANLRIGDIVNLERCMLADGRFDGHIVLGHVDQVGVCESIVEKNGSHVFTFSYKQDQGNVTVEKGSICVNGISLTVFDSKNSEFSVAVIPYTYKHTNLQYLKEGGLVNLEFDILGKYIKKICNKY